MKKLSTCINTVVNRLGTEVFLLVEILKSPPILLTTLGYNITMSGPGYTTRTYTADGPIVAIDPPRMSKTVDREAYKINLADTDGSLRVLFDEGLVGTEVAVIMGFINNGPPLTSSSGVSVGTGEAFTDYRDTIVVYRGAVDTTGITTSFSEDTNIATIECSSPMASLDMKNSFFTSKDSMRTRHPTDCSFDFVHQTSGAAILLWGKS
jgi:hypothetical protein